MSTQLEQVLEELDKAFHRYTQRLARRRNTIEHRLSPLSQRIEGAVGHHDTGGTWRRPL